MIQIVNGKEIPIKDTAIFVSKLNQQKVHHIGFCGTDREEIQKSIKEDVSEMMAAVKDGKLIGWIGADTDEDTAEVWGPFVDAEYNRQIAFNMWKKLLEKIPDEVSNFILFSNRENKLLIEFAEKLQFEQKTDQFVLKFPQAYSGNLLQSDLKILKQKDHMAFTRLHDEAFPSTYYSGKEIIERHSQTQKIFVLKDGNRLAGYVYVEAYPEFRDGSIEFIAVDPECRGKGFGKKLLSGAVHWLFTFDSIDEIQLTTAADNKSALGLYLSVGFKVENELHYFMKICS